MLGATVAGAAASPGSNAAARARGWGRVALAAMLAAGCAGGRPPSPRSQPQEPDERERVRRLEYLRRDALECEEAQAREAARKQAEDAARRTARDHLNLLFDIWSKRWREAEQARSALMAQFPEAYLRHVDMHAAGLDGKDESKVLREPLTRLNTRINAYDPDADAAPAVLRLLVAIDRSPPSPDRLDALVAETVAIDRPWRAEAAEAAREALQRHIDKPDPRRE